MCHRSARRLAIISNESKVVISPSIGDRAQRDWDGLTVETCSIRELSRREFQLKTSRHFLCYCEDGQRRAGELSLAGRHSRFTKPANRLFFAPTGVNVAGAADATAPHNYIYIYFDSRSPLLSSELQSAFQDLEPRADFEDHALAASLKKLRQCVGTVAPHAKLYGESLASVVAIELARSLRRESSVGPQAVGGLALRQLRLVEAFMREHIDEEIGLTNLARLVGLSPWHFCRAFKASTGLPPHRWLVRNRIEKSRELLDDHQLTATEVALASGFGGSTQFSRAFRHWTGMSPTQYRRRGL
jgi:AraC family transcriptional regulator